MSLASTTTIYGKIPAQTILSTVQEKKTKFNPFGLNFPLGPNAGRGYWGKVTGVELLRDSVRQVLLTERGERLMLPGFGVSLKKYLFQPLDEDLFRSIKSEVLTAISKYTKFVDVLKIGVYSLDSVGLEGLQAVKILVVLRLRDEDLTQFEVEVDIK